MTYRTILLALLDDPGNEQRIRLARRLAERFEGQLVGLHVSPPPILPFGYGDGSPYLGPELILSQREAAAALAERLRASFERTAEPAATGAVFVEQEGDPGERLAQAAWAADLTIAPRTLETGLDALPAQLVEQAVIAAGGPLLMIPPDGWQREVGTQVLCAWNGSREAARALKDALPFLRGASRTTLVGIGELPGPPLAEVAAMLGRHGITAEPLGLEAEGDAGATLLRIAAERSCDLLVMGAYGRSRVRQLILGGVTRTMVREAALPVLLGC